MLRRTGRPTTRRKPTFLDVTSTTLDEWLALLRQPPHGRVFAANHFPTDEHRQQFLDRIAQFSAADLRMVLRRFLVSTGSNALDQIHARYVADQVRNGTLREEDMVEPQRRLLRHQISAYEYPVWEGVHWVLDLLPHQPRQALAVLDAFMYASAQFLTDAYLNGLSDAAAVIRQRYIVSPGTAADAAATLDSLHWRELEWICGALYHAMDFATHVTPRSGDDGIDVLATGLSRGKPTRMVIQAKKRSSSGVVEKSDVRELVGAMDAARATGGVIITTGRFASGAREMMEIDKRIDLIERSELVDLLNEHCGPKWYLHVARLIAEARRRASSDQGSSKTDGPSDRTR